MRYVVLRHEGIAQPHYDLMWERSANGPLASVRLSEWPITPLTKIERIGDHRRDYLDYEGPVSGNRGNVIRVAAGECSNEDPDWLLLDDGTRICVSSVDTNS